MEEKTPLSSTNGSLNYYHSETETEHQVFIVSHVNLSIFYTSLLEQVSGHLSTYSDDEEESSDGFLTSIVNYSTDLIDSMFGSSYTRLRKLPVKVEPKVFFANERTFLAWMNMSVTLASIAVAILSFGDSEDSSQLYGFVMLPVSVVFCLYALFLYLRRGKMIKERSPGPYADTRGPIILSIILAIAIIVNFTLKLYDIANSN